MFRCFSEEKVGSQKKLKYERETGLIATSQDAMKMFDKIEFLVVVIKMEDIE